MRKQRSSLLLMIILLLLLQSTSLLGAELEKREIRLEILEESREIEAFYQSGQILVPARTLAQALDADLDWVPSLSTLKLSYNSKDFLLRVDEELIQVGDKVKRLQVPVLLLEGRTYLSLFCMSTILGFRLLEEEEGVFRMERPSHQLREITYEEGEVFFTIDGDPTIHFSEDLSRERVVVEILDVEKAQDFKVSGFTNDIPVERIRIDRPEVDRLLITFFLNQWQEYFVKNLPSEDEEMVFQMTPGATITQFGYDDERNRFVLVVRGEINDYSSMTLKDPYRLVIDIPTSRLEEEMEYIPKHPLVEQIRLGQHEKDLVRIVFHMEEILDFDFTLSPDGRFLVLTGEKRDLLINQIAFEEDNGRPQVVITGTQTLDPEIFYLPDPHRLVLDFPYSALNLEAESIEVGRSPVRGIRASQYPGEKSRVVIDLDEYVEYLVKTDPQHPEKTVIAFPPGDFHVFLQETPAATRVVIDAPYELDFALHKYSSPDRLVVDLKDAILHISPEDIPTGNGMVKDVELTHFSSDPVLTRLVFHLPYYIGHTPMTTDRNSRIEIDLFKSDLRGRVIFLDPGHGGKDPGAVGVMGTFEKDVVLDISLRLERLLKQAGAQVIMSRRQDVFIDLYDRTEKANRSPADIFVSIHANSVAHDFPMGTETYISRNHCSLSLELAQLVQHELIQYLGLHNRGVKKRDFHVIRAARMPSILVEVAFLSNEQEELLLKDPTFRQRSAEAIFSGIKKYYQVR